MSEDKNMTMTDDQFLAQYRREGRDMDFAHYLLRQRFRILGHILMRDAVAPWALPVCNWLERRLR